MAKDYTDYVALILEAEKRVYHIYHHRSKESTDMVEIEHNGHSFIFDRDRAFRINKWKPWKKVNPKRPVWTLNELLRSKKVGLLLYREPLPKEPRYEEVHTEIPDTYSCKICGPEKFTTEHPAAIKSHITRRHRGAKHSMVTVTNMKTITDNVLVKERVQPIHISRMHQPSGEMRA
jgi:hypothetical protein